MHCHKRRPGLTRRFWITHAALPAVFFAIAFLWIDTKGVDFWLANAAFYDAARGTWLGRHTWWAEQLIHTGGRDLVRAVAAIALLIFLGSLRSSRLMPLHREASYVFLAIALGTGIVGLLKQLTNVDCPWDLAEYGGTHAFVTLFGQREPGLARVACFPGAHASAGFALMAFYFVLHDRHPRAAGIALLAGIVTGVIFAFGQEARGAHFVSHDLTSAAIDWYAQLALYRLLLAPTAAHSPPHPTLAVCRNDWRALESQPGDVVALHRQEPNS